MRRVWTDASRGQGSRTGLFSNLEIDHPKASVERKRGRQLKKQLNRSVRYPGAGEKAPRDAARTTPTPLNEVPSLSLKRSEAIIEH